MKRVRVFAIVIAAALALATPAGADWMSLATGAGQVQVAKITAPATASAAAVSGQAAFYGIVVKTDAVNAVTVNVYDNTAASGPRLIPTDTVIPGSDRTWALGYSPAIKCATGIYVAITVAGGGSATYQVQYDK